MIQYKIFTNHMVDLALKRSTLMQGPISVEEIETFLNEQAKDGLEFVTQIAAGYVFEIIR